LHRYEIGNIYQYTRKESWKMIGLYNASDLVVIRLENDKGNPRMTEKVKRPTIGDKKITLMGGNMIVQEVTKVSIPKERNRH